MVAEGDAGLFNLVGGSVLTALMVVVVAGTVDRMLAGGGTDLRTRRNAVITAAIVVAFGTSAWSVLSRAMWSQATSTLLIAVVLYEVVCLDQAARDDRRAWSVALGATTAAAYTARPTNAVCVVAVGVWLLVQHRRQLVPYMLSGLVVGIGWIAVNLRRGARRVPRTSQRTVPLPTTTCSRRLPETWSRRIGACSSSVQWWS